jgi:hypothetical protein
MCREQLQYSYDSFATLYVLLCGSHDSYVVPEGLGSYQSCGLKRVQQSNKTGAPVIQDGLPTTANYCTTLATQRNCQYTTYYHRRYWLGRRAAHSTA